LKNTRLFWLFDQIVENTQGYFGYLIRLLKNTRLFWLFDQIVAKHKFFLVI
jgi:hypothetical protein